MRIHQIVRNSNRRKTAHPLLDIVAKLSSYIFPTRYICGLIGARAALSHSLACVRRSAFQSRCRAVTETLQKMAKYIAAGIMGLFATAEGLDLTPANFEAEVKGEKNAFVKFLAPW